MNYSYKERKAAIENDYKENLITFKINSHFRTLKLQLKADKILSDNGINNIKFIKVTYPNNILSKLLYGEDIPDGLELGYFFQMDKHRNAIAIFYKNGELQHGTLHRLKYNWSSAIEDMHITNDLEECIKQIKLLIKPPVGCEKENSHRLNLSERTRLSWRKYNMEGIIDYVGLANEVLAEYHCSQIKFTMKETKAEICCYFIQNGLKVLKLWKNKSEINSRFLLLSTGEDYNIKEVISPANDICELFNR